jgi:hypothetical protein
VAHLDGMEQGDCSVIRFLPRCQLFLDLLERLKLIIGRLRVGIVPIRLPFGCIDQSRGGALLRMTLVFPQRVLHP